MVKNIPRRFTKPCLRPTSEGVKGAVHLHYTALSTLVHTCDMKRWILFSLYHKQSVQQKCTRFYLSCRSRCYKCVARFYAVADFVHICSFVFAFITLCSIRRLHTALSKHVVVPKYGAGGAGLAFSIKTTNKQKC